MKYFIIIAAGCTIICFVYFMLRKNASSGTFGGFHKTETAEERQHREEEVRIRREEEEESRREEEARIRRIEEERIRRIEEVRIRQEEEARIRHEEKRRLAELKSPDEIFAEENNLWVCEYCETFNPNGDAFCAACGAEKN